MTSLVRFNFAFATVSRMRSCRFALNREGAFAFRFAPEFALDTPRTLLNTLIFLDVSLVFVC